MLREIKKRIKQLEQRIWAKLTSWPDDDDGFISALGLNESEKKMFQRQNPGGVGYDIVGALSFTAARDWGDGEN